MTPLAHRIANELTLPVKERTFQDRDPVQVFSYFKNVENMHCFDASSVWDAAYKLTLGRRAELAKTCCFLPAPLTWIEYIGEDGRRSALLCSSMPNDVLIDRALLDGSFLVFYIIEKDDGSIWSCRYFFIMPSTNENAVKLPLGAIYVIDAMTGKCTNDNKITHAFGVKAAEVISILAMINTPRIIGRRQHMPHAGLQRKLARAKGMFGKFPLHAWTEIVLEVTPPKMDDGEPHEARLTGSKALHFCRSHLRIQNGKLVLVKAHWRGDPALGIKQSRYRLSNQHEVQS